MSTLKASNIQNAGSATTNITLDTSGNATVAGTLAMGSSFLRNRLINGGMDIWQRGTGAFTTVFGYTADRWYGYGSTSISVSRSTDVPNSSFTYSASISGTGSAQIAQRIEAANCLGLNGGTITVSFWAKQTSGAGANSLGIAIYSANAADNFSATTFINSATFTGSASWTYYTATFTSLPSGVANGIQCVVYSPLAGATTYLVTGVQLEPGSIATPFERRSYGQELALCQRYCIINTSATASGTYARFATGMAATTSQAAFTYYFPVQMRAYPSLTAPAGSNFIVAQAISNNIGTGSLSLASDGITQNTCIILLSVSGTPLTAASGVALLANNTNSAYLLFTSEL